MIKENIFKFRHPEASGQEFLATSHFVEMARGL